MIRLFHRWGGGLVGLFLAIVGVTGALLVHRDTIVALTLPQPVAASPELQVPMLAADTDLEARFIVLPSERFGHYRTVGPDGAGAYVAGDGLVIGTWENKWDRPELWVFDLHTHLLAGEAGGIATGIFALAGLVFIVTGLLLWWPTRKTFEWRLLPRRMTRPAIIRHHRDLGVVLSPLLALSLLTGAAMAIKPIGGVLVMPWSSPAELQAAIRPPLLGPAAQANSSARPIAWKAIFAETRRQYPGAELRIIGLPTDSSKPMFMRLRQDGEWTANGRTMLWFDPASGRLLRNDDGRNLLPGLQAYFTFYPLHTGEAGGFIMRLLMTLSGLGMAFLGSFAVWTFWFRPIKRKQPVLSALDPQRAQTG
ncbi:PepSY-associated TM helix domain-containing protein [Oscillatoria laete-virens NRMC-F 0139]|nr:PepSY-associated TM helix domain-containing protein [Oscillatoria laete-virens]MDL5054799.1 PepSY-associated TM helix domain-containing protein [Oscillatoria laete-virens NRMC-F 0139]